MRLSDFHKMAVTITKTIFEKLKPKIIQFKNSKQFCNGRSKQNLLSKHYRFKSSVLIALVWQNFCNFEFTLWTSLLQENRNIDVEIICLVRTKHYHCVTMKRTRFRNHFLENRSAARNIKEYDVAD